jgi:hypothetical protein
MPSGGGMFDGFADAPHSKTLTHPGGQFLLDFFVKKIGHDNLTFPCVGS